MQIAEAFVRITAKTETVEKDVAAAAKRAAGAGGKELEKGLGDGAKKAGQTAGKQLEDGLTSSAKKAALAIGGAFAAIKIGSFVKDAIDQASRLEQAVGGTQAVFGDAAAAVDEFAEHAAEGIGVSNSAARELTSSIGGILKGMGLTREEAAKTSIQLATLGADLSATFGGKSEDAVRALGAALRGEFDPLEQFGISLNQTQINLRAVELGLASSTSNVDQNAKAQAALSLIMERSADAQGQFAAQSGTAAEQQQIAAAKAQDASAKFGSQILPIYAKAQQVIGFLADAFGSLPGPVQTALVALAGVIALSGPLSAVMGIVGKIAQIGPALTGLIAANPVIFGLAAAAGAAAVAFTLFSGEESKASKEGKALAGELANAAASFDKNKIAADSAAAAVADFGDEIAGVSRKHLLDAIQQSSDLQKALNTVGVSVDDVGAALKGNLTPGLQKATEVAKEYDKIAGSAATSDWADELDRLGKKYGTTREETQKLVESGRQLNDFLGEQGAAAGKATEELVRLAGTGDANRAAALKAQGNYDLLTGAMRENADAALTKAAADDKAAASSDKAADSANKLTGSMTNITKASDLAKSNLGPLKASVKGIDDAFDDATSAANAFKSAIDLVLGGALGAEEANRAYEAAIDEVTASLKENGKTLDIGTEKGRANREALEGIATAGVNVATAMARNGAAQTDVAARIQATRDQLVTQAQQFGLTKAQAEQYANELGLTPENIATAVSLAGADVAQKTLSDYIKNLDGISAEERTTLLAYVDKGDLAAAQSMLDALAFARTAPFKAETSNVSGVRKQLDDTAKSRTAKITAESSVRAAEHALDATADPRTARITATASTAVADAQIDRAARDRDAVIRVRAIGSGVAALAAKGVMVGQERGGWLGQGQVRRMDRGGFAEIAPRLRVGEGGPESAVDPFILAAGLERRMEQLDAKTGIGGVQQVTLHEHFEINGKEIYEVVRKYDRLVRGGR